MVKLPRCLAAAASYLLLDVCVLIRGFSCHQKRCIERALLHLMIRGALCPVLFHFPILPPLGIKCSPQSRLNTSMQDCSPSLPGSSSIDCNDVSLLTLKFRKLRLWILAVFCNLSSRYSPRPSADKKATTTTPLALSFLPAAQASGQ